MIMKWVIVFLDFKQSSKKLLKVNSAIPILTMVSVQIQIQVYMLLTTSDHVVTATTCTLTVRTDSN